MEATVHHMPAAMSRAGISSAIQAISRPAEGPPVQAMVAEDCHAASQRIGASRVSTAPCQSAGNNCANDSNMIVDLGWRCASGRAMIRWCAIAARWMRNRWATEKPTQNVLFNSDELLLRWETVDAQS